MPQLDETRASLVMNISGSEHPAKQPAGVSATSRTQRLDGSSPVRDRSRYERIEHMRMFDREAGSAGV